MAYGFTYIPARNDGTTVQEHEREPFTFEAAAAEFEEVQIAFPDSNDLMHAHFEVRGWKCPDCGWQFQG